MKRYEYKIDGLNARSAPNIHIEAWLNEMSRAGWEIVKIDWPTDGNILFKRLVSI